MVLMKSFLRSSLKSKRYRLANMLPCAQIFAGQEAMAVQIKTLKLIDVARHAGVSPGRYPLHNTRFVEPQTRDGVLKRPLLRSTTRRIFAPASYEPAKPIPLPCFGAKRRLPPARHQ